MVGGKMCSLMKKSWVKSLVESEFFVSCMDHRDSRKNEKNLFCIDCNLCLCKHCTLNSSLDHRLLQICKYVYHQVVRLHHIQPHLDCSLIQAYKINGEMAVHLNPRPQQKSKKTKSGGTCCEACERHIQDLPNRFCSIACKFSSSILKSTRKNVDGISSLESTELCEEESSYENGYASSFSLTTDSSSEVIQAWWNSPLRPKKRKRKSSPTRSPFC